MPRDDLLLAEMVEAAERAVALVAGKTVEDLEADRTLRDALLWNFTVLGEASVQLSDELKVNRRLVCEHRFAGLCARSVR